MITRDECLDYAAECEQMARTEKDPDICKQLQQLAKTWRELAEQMRNLPPVDS
jgi:hypothetical protein